MTLAKQSRNATIEPYRIDNLCSTLAGQSPELHKSREVVFLGEKPVHAVPTVLVHVDQIYLHPTPEGIADDGLQGCFGIQLLPLCTVGAVTHKLNDDWSWYAIKVLFHLQNTPALAIVWYATLA